MAAISHLCSHALSLKSSPSLSFASPSSCHPRRSTTTTTSLAISCKGGGDGRDGTSSENTTNNGPSFDRRDMLLGLGGLYGATSGLVLPRQTFASPIQAPDISKCHSSSVGDTVLPDSCCPPFSDTIVDFVPKTPNRIRVRPAVQNMTPDQIAAYEEATKLMKELPTDDPRSFMQQANVHCAYCNDGYDQVGFPELPIQIHFSWLFFPFHRWYLYFYEKILGKLIGDDDFVMPFWNYDAPVGMQIPSIFDNESSPLYDPIRNQDNRPPKVVDLTWPRSTDDPPPDDEIIANNLTIMYRQMVSNSKKPRMFFGEKYVTGSESSTDAQGSVEFTPHTPIHSFVGDRRQPNAENMGNFYSAGRDPIFYCHHMNVDRLWDVWKQLSRRNRDPRSSEFLDANFSFYDENKRLVRVRVGDCLDSSLLGYRYESVDLPWLEKKPRPSVPRKSPKQRKVIRDPRFPVRLTSAVSTLVNRPKKSRSKKEKEDEEEVVIIKGIDFDRSLLTKFDVFVNSPDNAVTPGGSEFAGSFIHLAHIKGKKKKNTKSTLTLGLTDLLDDIKADDDDDIIVTIVPRKGKVTIGGVAIEFLTDDD